MFKADTKQGYKDFIEVNGEKYEFTAYPMDTETILLLVEGQKEEDQVKVLRAMIKYFDECIEFERKGFKDSKKEIRKALERSGQFFEFVNHILEAMGKQTEEKD